jgi:hypothetical protein
MNFKQFFTETKAFDDIKRYLDISFLRNVKVWDHEKPGQSVPVGQYNAISGLFYLHSDVDIKFNESYFKKLPDLPYLENRVLSMMISFRFKPTFYKNENKWEFISLEQIPDPIPPHEDISFFLNHYKSFTPEMTKLPDEIKRPFLNIKEYIKPSMMCLIESITLRDTKKKANELMQKHSSVIVREMIESYNIAQAQMRERMDFEQI